LETAVPTARGFFETTGSAGDCFPRGCHPRHQDSRCRHANCGATRGTQVACRLRLRKAAHPSEDGSCIPTQFSFLRRRSASVAE
jgi:hypothetical protein